MNEILTILQYIPRESYLNVSILPDICKLKIKIVLGNHYFNSILMNIQNACCGFAKAVKCTVHQQSSEEYQRSII